MSGGGNLKYQLKKTTEFRLSIIGLLIINTKLRKLLCSEFLIQSDLTMNYN